jgi:hypothetical protein
VVVPGEMPVSEVPVREAIMASTMLVPPTTAGDDGVMRVGKAATATEGASTAVGAAAHTASAAHPDAACAFVASTRMTAAAAGGRSVGRNNDSAQEQCQRCNT